MTELVVHWMTRKGPLIMTSEMRRCILRCCSPSSGSKISVKTRLPSKLAFSEPCRQRSAISTFHTLLRIWIPARNIRRWSKPPQCKLARSLVRFMNHSTPRSALKSYWTSRQFRSMTKARSNNRTLCSWTLIARRATFLSPPEIKWLRWKMSYRTYLNCWRFSRFVTHRILWRPNYLWSATCPLCITKIASGNSSTSRE